MKLKEFSIPVQYNHYVCIFCWDLFVDLSYTPEPIVFVHLRNQSLHGCVLEGLARLKDLQIITHPFEEENKSAKVSQITNVWQAFTTFGGTISAMM